MPRWLRIAVMWLVAFAVPAQSLAAAAMAFCDKSHERHAVQLHANQGDDAAAHNHHHAHEAVTPTGDDGASSHDAAHAGGCSVCTLCYSSAALQPAVMAHSAPAGPPDYVAARSAAAVLFLTDALDRPPCPPLA